jgi:formylglycine-generating enzyme required for sulfatase activity
VGNAMKFLTDSKKFKRLVAGIFSRIWKGSTFGPFSWFEQKSSLLNQRIAGKKNPVLPVLYFAAFSLVTLFSFIPDEAFSKGGIVAVPINDAQGNQVLLYKASYALVIGISDYTGGWPKLPGVKSDVKAVKETLEKIGFKVIFVEDPDRRELEDAFKNFVLDYGLDPENRLLIYYAGHGYTHKPNYASDDPEEWMGYLVARNAPIARDNLANFFKHSVTMRTIENTALSIESKHAMFIFDSCFSGSIFGLSRGIPQDIQERIARPVRQFITSGTADQVVPDISIFRRQFISALEGEADRNQDGYVTGSELGLFLEETVTNLSRRSQTPRYGKILNRFLNKGDFIFKVFKEQPYQVASLNPEVLIESINRMSDQVAANRGERSSRVQIHYSKLKELDKFDKGTISNKTKIKLWQDFIKLFPNNNPHLKEAKSIVNALSGNPSPLPIEEDSIDRKIETRFASLMELEQKPISPEKKIAAWSGFVSNYPKDNPKLDLALAKIAELRKEQKRLADEKRLAEEQAQKEEQARLAEEKRLAEEEAKIMEQQRLAEEKRLAEEQAQKEKQARLVEQKRLAEEAGIMEQQRLAEEKRLAEEQAQKEKQARLVEQKRLAEEAGIMEQQRLAEEKRLAEEQAQKEEQARLAEQKRLAEEKRPSSKIQAEVEVARLEPGLPKPSPKKLTGHEGMALIASGKFVYGEPGSQETRVLKAFYMDVQEVVQKDYEQVMGKNPSRFKGGNLPVEKVTWREAKEYCKRLGKRLPTNEEWEKAARAGASSIYYWGNTLGKNKANCNDCGSQWDGLETAPARSFAPNGWGLYDMAGNVWEWVDKTHNKKFKVLRGGSWMDDSSFIPTAASYFILPGNRSSDVGFRCAMTKGVKVASLENSLNKHQNLIKERERLADKKRLTDEMARRKKERQAVKKSQGIEVARLDPKVSSSKKLTGHEGMALIASGRFVFGEPGSQRIKILRAFYIDVQEVVQKDFEQVMGKNPSRFKGGNLPVEKVTWREAKEYCKRTGKRLPTSEEWEKAARAGTSSKYYWGSALGKNKANCNDCGSQWGGLETAPARSFAPNGWGLYDMAGNVWEWVDKTHNKKFKVLRGGSWMDDSSFIPTAASYFVMPENRSSDIGFRCAKAKK